MLDSKVMLQIIECEKKRNIQSLQQTVNGLNTKEIINDINRNLNDPMFPTFWDAFMQGFNSSSEALGGKYFQIICRTLEELKTIQMSMTNVKTIISSLALELPKFKTNYLVKLMSECIESIQVGNVSWLELFPDLLNIIGNRDEINDGKTTCTGAEYAAKVIESLCMMQWSSNILVTLAIMFVDANLSKNEHQKVTNKLLENMDSLATAELPLFVHNMLKFCKHIHSKYVFFKLESYFNSRIYSLEIRSSSDSDSMGLIDVSPEPSALEAEANILYHVYHAALSSYESIKNYLNCLKSSVNVPEFVLRPFQIVLLLTISKVAYYQELVFDIIKTAITKTYKEELKRNDSIWFSEIVSHNFSIDDVFLRVIKFNSEQKQPYIKQGLMALCFAFLSYNASFGNESVAQKHWKHGHTLLLEVIKMNRSNANYIVHTLCNYILTKESIVQYLDLLQTLCRNQTILMLENQNSLVELVESLIKISNKKGIQVLEVIGLLTSVSSVLRDQLILILRKALYSRSIAARQTAVSGFLQILSHIKIKRPSALSLSDSSGSSHSLLTQISASGNGSRADVFTGESLSLELLIILKRCFMQQAEVKSHLYKGLCNVVGINAPLHVPILELLMPHFTMYYEFDNAVNLPLKFSQSVITKDEETILQEPLGAMIQLISKCVSRSNLNEDIEVAKDFADILNNICSRIIKCSLTDYGLEGNLDLTDPTSKANVIVLKEIMIVYNALINYKISMWTNESSDSAKDIESLHDGYYSLLQYANNAKKKDKRNKSTSMNADASLIEKSNNVEMPSIDYNPEELTKILQLLYSEQVHWASADECNLLKGKIEFHRHILRGVYNYIERVKEDCNQRASALTAGDFDYLEKIANILYNDCILKITKLIEYDMETVLLIMEDFHNILQLIFAKSDDVATSLKNICDEVENRLCTNLSKMIDQFITIYEENDVVDDGDTKRLGHHCLSILSLLSQKISHQDADLSAKVVNWLKNYCKQTSLTNRQTVTTLSSLLLKLCIKFKKNTGLYENIAKNMSKYYGNINMTHSGVDEFLLINENSANILLPILCNHLKTIHDDADWFLQRIKAESTILSYHDSENVEKNREKLKNHEREICCQICWLLNITNILSDLRITMHTEPMLKIIIHAFVTLNSIAKYFFLRSTKDNLIFEHAGFDKIVKIAGKELSPTVYNLILFLDEKQSDSASQSKRKLSTIETKILKETKLIPKLVFEIEQFSKSVIQLSKKTNSNLNKYLGQGTARDYRILNVDDILKNVQRDSTTDDTTLTSDDNSTLSTDKTTASDGTDEDTSTNSCYAILFCRPISS